ncbi:MAG TPA: patatin-like phospholipase family protein, partial [Thermoanaerobaculia bacterium]
APAVPGKQIDGALGLNVLWQGLSSTPETFDKDYVLELRKRFEDFLEKSRAEGLLGRMATHWLPDVYNYFRKNLALIWAILILLAVTLKVEAVNSLVRNEVAYNPPGFILPLVLLLVPLAISRVWTSVLRLQKPPRVPFWDISSSAFRSFHNQALEPGRLIQRWPSECRLSREIVKGQTVKLAVYVLWWWAAFGMIYGLHKKSMLGASGSSLTVFMVLSLCYAVLIVAHIVDLWEYLDPQPVRFIMLLASLGGLVCLLLGWGREFFIVAFLLTAAGYFYAWTRDRQRTLRLGLAAFFLSLAVANAVGRSTHDRAVWRDAGQTARWERLAVHEWPWPGTDPVVILAASGGGSRAAIYTGLTLRRLNERFPEIAEQLQAISSVSGGSLANAAYVARLLDLGERRNDRQARAAALADLDKDLGRDFLFPTLIGALTPTKTRGQSIEATWEDKKVVALGQHSLRELAAVWRSQDRTTSPNPPFPVPLFNSTTLDGHDLVISPLRRKLYTWDEMEAEARDLKRSGYRRAGSGDDDPYTWVYYRDGIYALDDVLLGFDPKLSQAVRASANFPFGFPLVRIETAEPLFFNPRYNATGKKEIQLTDGGALSNSGMWPLYHLLMPDEREKLAELKRRGVLLLVVEASKMPTYPNLQQSLNSLWSTIGDQGPVGQRLHRLMFEALGREYGGRIAIVQWDLISRESYNVLTSWALDGDSIQRLGNSFEQRWSSEEPILRQAWTALKSKADRGKPIISTQRPPLD